MECATLHFADTYGAVARFPNPSGINGAAGWLFLNHPDLIQYVCMEKVPNYTERYLPDIYAYVTDGQGILGSGGAYNKAQRKLCMPPFQKKASLQNFASSVVERADYLTSIWQSEGKFTADMAVQMQRLTLDIVGVVAFSHDFKQLRGMAEYGVLAKEDEIPTDRVLHDINVAQDIMGRVFVTPLPVLKALRAMRAPFMITMENAFADMKDAVMPIIQERREAKQRGETKEDLLDSLLEMQAELQETGEGFTDGELWEDVHDVMGAGHETTASTLSACLYTLSQHPEIDRKVQAELEAVLGGRLPTYEDFDQLVYTKQVVKEVLRLYPPIPIFPRLAKEDDVLPTGHKVSAGEVIFMSSYAMGRSEMIWEDPLTFDPSRFDEEVEATRHRFQWVPFGGGPRMCMGAGFAMLSTTLVLSTLVQKYKFKAVKDQGPVIPIKYDITMYFPDDMLMTVSPRE
ncbi:hypothetical protein CYMTET_24065 [Cymbomonas tetramitiformis]|uniref:Cytochrome P450 n=1 Tax=Cymbomonas tetramitiformis TaxID=36881 RepID=A0AAE0FWI6_9CHLO|nr:hypothetical protein CYMTET_24065 [Cymbomonas tetramitiformis]